MKPNQLNSDFLNQFRANRNAYCLAGEKNYRDISLKQFSGRSNEFQFICELANRTLSKTAAAKRIALKIKKRDIPNINHLLSFTATLQKTFSTFCKNEKYTYSYYQPILTGLAAFIKEMTEYKTTLNQLLRQLPRSDKQYRNDDYDNESALHKVYKLIKQLDKFLDHFTMVLKQESALSQGVMVTTQVEQYLLRLVDSIENNLVIANETYDSLEEWELRLYKFADLEIYN